MADRKVLIQVPYVPSTWHKIDVMMELANPQPGEKMVDLGSGDGRIVIAFAKKGIESHGYEINSELALLSESKILDENLDEKAFIHIADFWEADLSSFNIVIIYGMTSIMTHLEEKLKTELKPGSRVISAIFHFPNWEPTTQKDNVSLYCV
ncbi:MAG TPA: class I SAM-dependent methyltransferase [Candidatus Levybacteria bacterium]|nr:class I SAM-dependent methyltransferase [Candidatus Levybacteria bacterium]